MEIKIDDLSIRHGDFTSFTISVNDPQEPDAVYTIELYQGQIGSDPIKHNSDAIFQKEGLLNAAIVNLTDIDVQGDELRR